MPEAASQPPVGVEGLPLAAAYLERSYGTEDGTKLEDGNVVVPRPRRKSLPPFQGGNSALLTAGIIVADVVGAGILSMAVAVAKFGWLLGAVVIVVLLAMNVHISLLVWRVRMHCPAAYTYVALASAAFADAPAWQRRATEMVTVVSQQVFLFCTLGLYSLSFGQGLGGLFYDEWRLCLPVLTMLGLLLLAPVHVTSRSLGKWQSLVLLNVLTIVGTVLIPLVYMASSGARATRLAGSVVEAFADMSVVGVLSGLEVMSFAFTSQFMLVEIMSEMRRPEELPKAYMMSAPFQGIMFLICGVGGYYYLGSRVQGVIGENIPYGPAYRVAAFCLLVHMLITYLMKGVVFCRSMQSYLSPGKVNDASAQGWASWCGMTLASMTMAWVLAQVVPFFTDLIDLLGATLTPLSCYVIPIALYLRWLQDRGTKEDSIGFAEKILIAAELALSFVLMTAGTYFAFQHLRSNWHTYGPPFACHCQSIWATCECSAHHPGMEQCAIPGAA
mmetsp:Transcript_60768/g.195790  ORF Transcript_60768/g.195790 Transcript_60768/m.195790 type:complete len:500 (+) Transcript_60768:93-1592(+)